MDPITILGAAAAALQFVTFGLSLVSKTREIHASGSGPSHRNTDLAIVEASLTARTSKIRDAIVPGGIGPAANGDDQVILALCNRCLEISKELHKGLSRAGAYGTRRRWKSVRQALKSIWMRDEIEGLRNRLIEVRSELDSHVTASLPSRIDLVTLRQSEGFSNLERDIQALVDTIIDTQATLSKRIDDNAARVDSVVISSAQTTQDAIEEARIRIEDGQARSHVQLGRLEDATKIAQTDNTMSYLRAVQAIEQLREMLIQDKRAVEVQIARLEQEMKQDLDKMQKSLHRMFHGRHTENEQKELKDQTNLLCKIWAAKEVMLQKLKEFVAIIKSRLSKQAWLPRFPSFDLRSYEAAVKSTWSNWSKPEAESQELQVLTIERGRMLMHFIESASPVLVRNLVAQDVINLGIPITFDLGLLGSHEKARMFYGAIYPRARVGRDWDGRPATPAESAMLASLSTVSYAIPLVQINTTPMGFAVHQLGLQQRKAPSSRSIANALSSCTAPAQLPQDALRTKNLVAIIQILIDSGANLRVLDNAGLSAYDHARIWGLDGNLVVKLRPPNVFDGRTIPMPAATHPSQRQITSVSEVDLGRTSRLWEGATVTRTDLVETAEGMPQMEVLGRNASTATNRTR